MIQKPEEITIRVDPEAARLYRSASEDQRRKIDLLLSLQLRDATRTPRSLEQVMADIRRQAKERGLTPEILQQILDER